MRALRRASAAAALGAHRARAGGTRSALVVAGVVAAGGVLAAVVAGTALAEQRSLAQAVEALPPPGRTVRAAWFGIPAQHEPYRRLDAAARRALADVTGRPATATLLLRESSIGGAYVALGAVDGLARWVRLTSGRLPRSCSPDRCEVLQVRGGARVPRGIVVVGRGRLRTTALFGDAVPADRNELERARLAPALQRVARYHQPAPPPLLLAADVRAVSARPDVRSSYRSYGWVTEVHGDDVRPWSAAEFAADAARARTDLQQRSIGFELLAPAADVLAARDRARVGARRLLLLGGQGAVLLVAFAGFAATRVRRGARASDRRLVLFGTPRWQRALATAAHAIAIAFAGVLTAWFAAFAILAALGELSLATHALLGRTGIVAALVLAGGATAAAVLAVSVPHVRLTGRVVALDGLAAALVALVLVGVARGATDADELLRERGTGTVLFLLPIAVAAAAAIVVARALPVLVRLLARALPDGAVAGRLAALSLARRPGAGSVAAAFLVVSLGLTIFAGTYRSTLERGQREQAAFALGADLVLREDLSRLVPVRRVATPARLRALGPEVDAAPVIRAGGNVAGLAGATGITVLGLDRMHLDGLRGTDVAIPNLRVPARLRGPRIPLDARELRLDARATTPGLELEAAVRARDGSFERLRFATESTSAVAVPRPARGGTLIGFRLVPPPRLQERGADAGQAATGAIFLGSLDADGVRLDGGYEGWVGVGGVSLRAGRLAYTLSPQVDSWFRPRQPLDGKALPALVSPTLGAVAGERGRIPLDVGGRRVDVRVAAVAPRFPSARGDFVVVDRRALATTLDLAEPGSGIATEAWANARNAAAEERARERLRRPPFDALRLDSRVEREHALRREPLARGALAMLAVAAGAAFVLTLLAVALAAMAEVRDERAELVDLESQGAPPRLLRRVVALRQVIAGVLGTLGGVATGAALATLVVALVSVSASGESPVPPLEVDVDTRVAAAAVVATVAIGALIVLVATRRAVAAPEAGRPLELE